jgi:hypothetical protein
METRTFWVNRPIKGWYKTLGHQVEIKGYEEFVFFAVDRGDDGWGVYEAISGRLITPLSKAHFGTDKTPAQAVYHAKGILDGRGKKELIESIKEVVEQAGISPHFINAILKNSRGKKEDEETPFKFLDIIEEQDDE